MSYMHLGEEAETLEADVLEGVRDEIEDDGTFYVEGNFGSVDMDDIADKLRWLKALEDAGLMDWDGIPLALDIYTTFKV